MSIRIEILVQRAQGSPQAVELERSARRRHAATQGTIFSDFATGLGSTLDSCFDKKYTFKKEGFLNRKN
jgi:hypothetical protein